MHCSTSFSCTAQLCAFGMLCNSVDHSGDQTPGQIVLLLRKPSAPSVSQRMPVCTAVLAHRNIDARLPGDESRRISVCHTVACLLHRLSQCWRPYGSMASTLLRCAGESSKAARSPWKGHMWLHLLLPLSSCAWTPVS